MPVIIRLKWLMTAFLTGMMAAGYYNALGQNPLAQTDVFTYSRNQYGAGSQNWAIEMDGYNRLFFANNEGVLVFNGKGWQLFPVPNKTIRPRTSLDVRPPMLCSCLDIPLHKRTRTTI